MVLSLTDLREALLTSLGPETQVTYFIYTNLSFLGATLYPSLCNVSTRDLVAFMQMSTLVAANSKSSTY